MDAYGFVNCWKREKNELLEVFTNLEQESAVTKKIALMQLSQEQSAMLRSILDDVLTDTLYSFLLGLDGSASIGGVQQTYQLYDELGNSIYDTGELSSEAFEQFRGESEQY